MFSTYFNREKSTGVDFSSAPSMTEQHHKDEVDINRIVSRALRTGLDPSLIKSFGKYADCTEVGDFFSAQLKYREGIESFEKLPSKIRTRFNNDPAQLLGFLCDKKNRAEAEKLGLIDPIVAESPQVVPGTPLDVTGTTDTDKVSQ